MFNCMCFIALLAAILVAPVQAISQNIALTKKKDSHASKVDTPHYSTNSICRESNCVNPAFPGWEDLKSLSAHTNWQCQPEAVARPYLKFCKEAVNYDIAIPSPPAGQSTTLDVIINGMDDAAATTYFYHLHALDVEAWDHQRPAESLNSCVRSVWKMACHTYFPKAQAGCSTGQPTKYLRPCANVCENYVHQCSVECCDESVRCVFEIKEQETNGSIRLLQGYTDDDGPSHICTGAAWRRSAPALPALLPLLLGLIPGRHVAPILAVLAAALTLQGCDSEAPLQAHAFADWLDKASYRIHYQYIPPGKALKDAVLNSCELTPQLPRDSQCTGHGYCKQWNHDGLTEDAKLSFCECDRDWADPECRTRRVSQRHAYFLSLFGGMFGLDRFYMGDYQVGFLKLFSLGGFGAWWLVDVVRVGAAPIYAGRNRLAYDLPHWVFVVTSMPFFGLLGWLYFGPYCHTQRFKREKRQMLLKEEETWHQTRDQTPSFQQNVDCERIEEMYKIQEDRIIPEARMVQEAYGTFVDDKLAQLNPVSFYVDGEEEARNKIPEWPNEFLQSLKLYKPMPHAPPGCDKCPKCSRPDMHGAAHNEQELAEARQRRLQLAMAHGACQDLHCNTCGRLPKDSF